MGEYWDFVKDYFEGTYSSTFGGGKSERDFAKGKKVLEILKKDYKILDSIGVKDSRFPSIIDKLELEFEQKWKGYGIVFSKYFSQTSYSINNKIIENMQDPFLRLANSTKISDNFFYFNGGNNLTFFYFIFSNNIFSNNISDYYFSQEALKWKGSIIILNSFSLKNNQPPSNKIITKALNRKIELEKVIELKKGIIFENNTYFFSGR
jgi:hypothetical protein